MTHRPTLNKSRLKTPPRIPSGSQGAAGELIVCADLLRKGYEVFRAVSSSCSCDLLAMRNGVIERIEVRTRILNIDGSSSCPDGERRADVYAVVNSVSFDLAYYDTKTKLPLSME